jgi:hypothetical protein
MLLLDGHESHCNYPFLEYAWRHRILIHVLPAHSSHLTQPLDVGLFGPLQRYYGVLVAEWFKGGYPAISKADFFPLLQKARERTYTSNNIKRAWEGTGLVPYDRRKIQRRLGVVVITQQQPESPTHMLKTPKHPHQIRQILKYSQQLVLEDGPKELILSALEKLCKSGIEGQAQGAIAQHETVFLKKRLNLKANHKSSRVRIVKKQQGYARLLKQKDIEEFQLEFEAKQQLLAQKRAIGVRGKKGGKHSKDKGKAVDRQAIASSGDAVASGSGSGSQGLNTEGWFAI